MAVGLSQAQVTCTKPSPALLSGIFPLSFYPLFDSTKTESNSLLYCDLHLLNILISLLYCDLHLLTILM